MYDKNEIKTNGTPRPPITHHPLYLFETGQFGRKIQNWKILSQKEQNKIIIKKQNKQNIQTKNSNISLVKLYTYMLNTCLWRTT